MDATRRKLLKTGAGAAAIAATPKIFGQQRAPEGSGRFYEKAGVRSRAAATVWAFEHSLVHAA